MRPLKLPFPRQFALPLAISAAVLIGATCPLTPLVRVVAPQIRPIAILRTSALYTVLAPLSDSLDTATLFSPAQYWSTFALAAFCLLIIELLRRRDAARGGYTTRLVRCSTRLVGGTAGFLGLLLVLPRPMASLSLNDPDLVAVDFHSHTSASHDGRTGFDAEMNRAWHASAGFDVAYVTDHQTFSGALDATRDNPRVAGAGTVLLPGLELRTIGEHVIVIGADPLRTTVPTADFKDVRITPASSSIPPLLFLSMPGNVRQTPIKMSGMTVLGGVEVSDACPRGLAQTSAEAGIIASLTRKLGVPGVSGSDNHGWGRASAAWSVMRIRGWRAMSPLHLDDAIRSTIVAVGPRAVEVVARRRASPPESAIGTALSGAAAAEVMLRTMTWPERVSWISWTWILWLAAISRRRRRRVWASAGLEMKSARQAGMSAAAMEIA